MMRNADTTDFDRTPEIDRVARRLTNYLSYLR